MLLVNGYRTFARDDEKVFGAESGDGDNIVNVLVPPEYTLTNR